jgi:hypothetical protein
MDHAGDALVAASRQISAQRRIAMGIRMLRINPYLYHRDLGLFTGFGEGDVVGIDVNDVVRAIGPRQIGRIIIDQPAAIPGAARYRLQWCVIEGAAFAKSLIFAALAGWLADLRHLQQLAARLAVTALTHHADLFVALSGLAI